MLVPLLMGLLADLVFDSAGRMRRSFDSDMARYLEQSGFRPARPEPAETR